MLTDHIPADARPWMQEGAHPEDIRLMIREEAKRSTYFMGKAVIGFKDLAPRTHGPMAAFIDSSSTRKLGMVPRDHLKTSLWTIANTVRRVVCDSNERILLANETSTNASHFLRRIQAVWTNNQFFRWLFPELIPKDIRSTKWSETEMLIPRTEDFTESTIEAIGVGGAVVSRHYTLLKLDDLVGKEASESEEIMKKTIDWYQYCESLLVHPRESEIHVVGTRWGYNDLISWIKKHEVGMDVFERSCYVDGAPFWPERFDADVLEAIRVKMGTYKFSCQYLNAPHDPDSSSFDPKHLRYYTIDGPLCKPRLGPPADWRQMRRFMRVDPAISEADTACNTAIMVDGVDQFNRKFLLDYKVKKMRPLEMLDEMFNMHILWDPECCGIESVAYQKAIQHFYADEAARRGRHINITELKPDTHKSKKSRIRGLQPYFERGEVFIRDDHGYFVEEYSSFPTGVYMDLLDAFAYGPQMWGIPDLQHDISEDEERYAMERGRSASTGY